jgi:hypothetical protein
MSNEGEETDVSSQLGKQGRVVAQKETMCAWLHYDAFPFHICLAHIIYFSVSVLLDILSPWEKNDCSYKRYYEIEL